VTRWLRIALLVLLAAWTALLGSKAQQGCFLDLINLAFHEAGHLVFMPLGSTMHFLGGTLGQLAVPILLLVYFLVRERRPFAAAFCAWWIGENLVDIAVYMADARSLALPLVGGGEHDWNVLFYRFGLLGQDSVARVASLTHALGVLIMLVGFAWGACLVLPERLREGVRRTVAIHFPALAGLIG
jgi:hypothetical protein